MAGGFDEKAGGAQMGVMQGPMVRKRPHRDGHALPCDVKTNPEKYSESHSKLGTRIISILG